MKRKKKKEKKKPKRGPTTMSNFLKHSAMLDSVLKPIPGLTRAEIKHVSWLQSGSVMLQA